MSLIHRDPLMAPAAAAAYLGVSRGVYGGLLRRNPHIPVVRLTGQRVRRVRRSTLDQLAVTHPASTGEMIIARPALVDRLTRS